MVKGKRLSQIARELNVGLSTITDFLHKKNIQVEERPNAKVNANVYGILLGEFSSDKFVKTESEKIYSRKLSVVEEHLEAGKKEDIAKKSLKEIKKEVPEKKEIEKKIEEKPEEKKGPKIIGKIDLDAKPVVKQKKEEKKNVSENKQEESDKPEKNKIKKINPEKEIKKEETEQKKVAVKKTKTKETKETKEEAKEVTEKVVKDAPEGDKVKILGKIDLNNLNQQTRPTKKRTRAERKQDRIDRENASKKIVEQAKEEREKINSGKEQEKNIVVEEKKEDNFIKTKVQTLAGPTVVGKIELKKEKTDDSDRTKKRRRRRRKRLTKAVNKETTPATAGQGRATTGNRKRSNYKKRTSKVRAVITEEDVKQQVKATLAKLTSKKKKTSVKHRRDKRDEVRDKIKKEQEKQQVEEKILKVTEFISAKELASLMDVQVNRVISTCFDLGKMVQINQRLDADTISVVCEEYGFEADFVSVADHETFEIEEEDVESLETRAPIVTVMGHVDHGKTSLLDYIRKANVISGEAGGITQHIGAYSVNVKDNNTITFLDTPGHEAFTAMRTRGAQITDVAIIVVAATDSIMPQTKEAISHAQAANVPIVFAINKIDLPGADPNRIKKELAEMNLMVEEWGGKYQSKDISAKFGNNVDALLDEVILAAEMLELKANPNRKSIGTILESALDKGKGYVTTVLVQTGTLKVGDILYAGAYSGKIKAMYNERGQRIKEVKPAEPALILGLNGAPQAGVNYRVTETEKEARTAAAKYHQIKREQTFRAHKHITLDEIGRRLKVGNFQEVKVIVKGDFDGSIEAISDALIKLSTEEIAVKVIHQAVGQISEADVMLASASDAVIVGFQVRPSANARKLAEKEDIEIRLYSVIYAAIDDLKDAMEGMLSPEIKEETQATVEIRQVFNISKVGKVAGCYVLDGKIKRDSKIRLVRDGVVIHTGRLASLKRIKDDVKEVGKGYECGLNIDKFGKIKVGDIIEAFTEIEIAKKL